MALLGGAPALRSQQSEFGPYKLDLKVRLGFVGGDMQQAKFDNKILGFGLQVRRELFGPGSAVAAEVQWEHVPSRWHDIADYAKHNPPASASTATRPPARQGGCSKTRATGRSSCQA